MRRITMLATAAVVLILTGGAQAAEVEVKLFNKGSDGGVMVFVYPDFEWQFWQMC